MVNMIKKDAHLVPYLKNTLSDAGIEVGVDPSLKENDFAAIKVDDYYAGQKTALAPKAVDYVVVVDCHCDWFAMYILELKNVNSPKRLSIKDIQEKFTNTIKLFLEKEFKDIFLNDKFKYKGIKLYLVSDVYNEIGKFPNHAKYVAMQNKMRQKDTLKVDFSLSQKLYKFRGQALRIQYDIPPNPIITRI